MILQEPYRKQLIVISITAMFAGLLFSRALVSCGMGLLFFAAWINGNFRKNLLLFLNNRYYVFITLLFFIPLISGLWSADMKEWWQRSVVKLPLLIIPLAFAVMPTLSNKVYKLLSWIYILLIGAMSFWSFAKYAGDSIPVQDGYSKAAVMLVPFDDDHVRFSWAVVIAILLLVKLANSYIVNKIEKAISIIIVTWFVIYLHILAAKTGLITFYACFFIYCIYKVATVKNKLVPIACCLLPVVLLVIAYYALPTFHNRVHYVMWDFQQYRQGNYLPGTPDGARVLSWIGGWQIFAHNIFIGVGFGDVWNNMQQFYNSSYAYLPQHDRLFPNQFLIYGCGTGIAGLLIFSFVILLPFFIKENRKNIYWLCFHAGTLICLLTEMNLEGQYGVFLYCFFACWFRHKQFTFAN